MAARIESERKKAAFIEACDKQDPLKAIPENLLQAKLLSETLKQDEIDMSMLYKCGCPCEWIKDAFKQCEPQKNQKCRPKYSNECTTCWLMNLTEEIEINKKEYDIKDIMKKFKEYESFGLSPEELREILDYLGWNEIKDYGLFLDTVKDMKSKYGEVKD